MTRDPDSIKPCTYHFPEDANALVPEEWPLDVLLLCPFDFWTSSIVNTLLFKRGWVHQERLLSPRILQFGKKQLFWECSKLRACETYPAGIPEIMHVDPVPFSIEALRNPAEPLPPSMNNRLWANVVESFSLASITKPQDKLAAISGVAERMCRISKTGYVAGLLEISLPRSLCWMKAGNSIIRVTPYRAPSWSWASCEGRISFGSLMVNPLVDLCSIDRVSLDYVNPDNVYGQVKDGYLIISACVLQIDKSGSGVHLVSAETRTSFFHFSPAGFTTIPCSLVFDETSVAQDRAGCLCVIVCGKGFLFYGIIIAPVGLSGQIESRNTLS
jgi:hypothetical protein